jgi:hypothetical protein
MRQPRVLTAQPNLFGELQRLPWGVRVYFQLDDGFALIDGQASLATEDFEALRDAQSKNYELSVRAHDVDFFNRPDTDEILFEDWQFGLHLNTWDLIEEI